jgi:hemoglobin-like flavoprotein
MGGITKEQVRSIYALGSAAGILESGNKDDSLHALVRRVTGKDTVSSLTAEEYEKVKHELLPLLKYRNHKPAVPAYAPGMMNKAQQSLAWRYIYRLRELDQDTDAHAATVGERMVGAIKKVLGVDAKVESPFKWLSQEQGGALIEQLKRYVRSAERRKGVH